jgi:phenylalanyl-tRNA synthetase beta chain
MSDAPLYTFENLIRDRLISEGLQEMITCDLISPAMSEITKEPTQKDLHSLSVMQSKSNDYSVLRSSLLAGLLCSIKHNISHQIENISCFEIGRVHFKQKETVEELSCVAIALTGASRPHHHAPKGSEVDFFDMKGIIENLLSALKIEDVKYQPSHLHNFQPGRQATIECKGASIGVIGQLHPAKVSAMDITQKVYYAELNLHELITLSNREIKIKSLAQFPGSERDWTITVTKQTPIAHLLAAVYEQKTPLLETVFMLDLFESEKLGHDKKNITLRFCYRDSTKTLSYEAVEAEHASLMTKVSEKLHGCILQ